MRPILLIATIVILGGCSGMPVAHTRSTPSASRVPEMNQLPKPGERRAAARRLDEERAALSRTTVDGNLIR